MIRIPWVPGLHTFGHDRFSGKYTVQDLFWPILSGSEVISIPPSNQAVDGLTSAWLEVEETAWLLQTPSDKNRPPPRGPFPWAEGRLAVGWGCCIRNARMAGRI